MMAKGDDAIDRWILSGRRQTGNPAERAQRNALYGCINRLGSLMDSGKSAKSGMVQEGPLYA
jgi:hypothetical protein